MPNTDEIFDYVMNSPENTNPAVLRSMLNSVRRGGGGALVVNITESKVEGNTVYTCDKTAGEMAAALESGGIIIRRTEEQDGLTVYFYYPLSAATVVPDVFYSFKAAEPIGTLSTASASEYPANTRRQASQ